MRFQNVLLFLNTVLTLSLVGEITVRNFNSAFAALIGSVVIGLSSAHAATVVYQNDFEGGNDAELNGGAIAGTQGFSAHGHGQSFYHNTSRNDATTLSLSGLAPHSTVTITFDVALIDSWDRVDTTYGIDTFNVSADGGLIFSEIAGNSRSRSRLGDMETSLGNLFGQTRFSDATYTITLTFAHSGGNLDFSFFGGGIGAGLGYQGLLDENFAIDNITVTTDSLSTPLPAAAWFMGAGIAGYAASRRKKAA